MIDFYPGQRVVCVDASGDADYWGIVEGDIYTIDWVGPTPNSQLVWLAENGRADFEALAVRLVEIRRPHFADNQEPGWRPSRFRPLIETDISIFTAMLETRKVKQRESEDA